MNAENLTPDGTEQTAALSTAALARRKMLLKGLGRGSAVLGAAIPLQSLAEESVFTYNGTGTATQIRCGISGMTSGVHSRDITTNQCYGYSPGYYTQAKHFPPDVNSAAPITSVFPGCGLQIPNMVERCTTQAAHEVQQGDKTVLVPKATTCEMVQDGVKVPTLLEVMNVTPRPAEFHWLAAWLNAQPGSPAVNYPYSAAEIQAFYANSDAQAYQFLTKYMEQHPGS